MLLLVLFWIARNRYTVYQADLQAKKEMIYTVATWDLYVQVKVNAKASLLDEQNLSFGQEGKIIAVNVQVGDEVKAGDVLAELDLKDYEDTIKAAQLQLENAQFGLTKLLNNDTSLAQAQVRSQIKEAELSLSVETEQYAILQKQLSAALTQKRAQLEQTTREYEIAKSELDITTTEETSHAAAQVDRDQQVMAIISDLDAILWNMETVMNNVNDTFDSTVNQTFISAHDPDLRNRFKNNLTASTSFITNFDSKIININSSYSDNQIYAIVQDFYTKSIALITLCNNALDISKMSDELKLLSPSLSTYKSTAVALRWELKILRDSVSSLLSTYESHKAAVESQGETIAVLEKEIATMEIDNPNQLTRKRAQITNLKEQIAVLNEQLRHVKSWINAYDIKQQHNLVDQAVLNLERTKNQKDDYQIIADFDGRVRSVDIAKWEQYKLDDRKYIVVENPNLIELELKVSQIDIVKIKEGQDVSVVFDAYPYTPIKAKITSRDVNPEINERGWVYYTAKILLDKQQLEILAGMSAIVTVNTAEAKNVLIVPTLSLVQENGKTYVYLKQWSKYVLHEIGIWVSNNLQAAVLSGLTAWDTILASVLDDAMLEKMWIDGGGLSISLF